MKKILLLILISCSCSSAQVTQTVLARGVIYNWQIVRMTDFKTTDTYFNFKFVNANSETRGAAKISYGYIGFIGTDEKPELIDFILRLRQAAVDNSQSYSYGGYRFNIYTDINYNVLVYDWNLNYIKLTPANAKALATDIEKSIDLIK